MKNNIFAIAILLLISNFFYDYSKQEVKVMEREKIVKFIKSEIINNFDSNNFEISSLGIENTFPLNKIKKDLNEIKQQKKKTINSLNNNNNNNNINIYYSYLNEMSNDISM